MKAADIPAEIARPLRGGAVARPRDAAIGRMRTRVPRADASIARRSPRARQRLSVLLTRSTAATRSTRASSTRPASRSTRCASRDDLARLPFTTKAELVADQDATSAVGHGADRAARPLHALQPDLVDDRAAAPVARHERELAVDARVLEGRLSRGARVGPADRIFFAFSFGPFLGFWTAFDAACQIGAHAMPAGGMSSQQRLALDRRRAPTVVCCTPTYALRLAEVAAERSGRTRPLVRQQRPHGHRRRRTRRQHSGHARAHRARAGARA